MANGYRSPNFFVLQIFILWVGVALFLVRQNFICWHFSTHSSQNFLADFSGHMVYTLSFTVLNKLESTSDECRMSKVCSLIPRPKRWPGKCCLYMYVINVDWLMFRSGKSANDIILTCLIVLIVTTQKKSYTDSNADRCSGLNFRSEVPSHWRA